MLLNDKILFLILQEFILFLQIRNNKKHSSRLFVPEHISQIPSYNFIILFLTSLFITINNYYRITIENMEDMNFIMKIKFQQHS